ncbi:translocase of chloroplast 120, chloroplastic-like [Vigna unguiculata]|uniref:translocase of chloroplast 120, chloroplastic-like n=1 Tax=Vigna unguiculata TaxID=3917 RepID=UPI0010166DC6|nr:translocase of chloroplast 120, chloroplastic-like [Vigna unguiculata]
MDYEADGFGANGEGESKRVGEGVSEEIVVGSDSLKSLDVEEDFQEAMEPREQVHDQGSELHPEEAVVDKQDDANVGSSLASALVDEKSPDVVQEPDSSKEAVGDDSESGKLGGTDVIANQDLERDGPGTDSVHPDVVDSGVSRDEDFFYGSNGVGDDNLERNDGIGGKEESGLNSDVEVSDKENGVVVDENSGLTSDKAEFDDSDFMTPRENGGITLEDISIDKEDGLDTEVITKSESDAVIPAEGTDDGDLKDADPELGDGNTEVKLNGSADSSGEIQDDTCEEVHATSAHTTSAQQDEVTRDVKDATLGTDMSHEDRNGEETSAPSIQNAELTGYGNGDAEDESSSSLENPSTKETLPIQEGSAADPNEGSNKHDPSTKETLPIQGGSAADPNEGSNKHDPSTKETLPIQGGSATDPKEGTYKDDQAQISDENHRDDENSYVVEEPERIQEKIIKETGTTEETGEQPDQPSADISSADPGPPPLRPSPENSAGAGPTPVRPAGLGRAAPLLEPASRVVQQPRANGTVSNAQAQQMEDSSSGEAEEYDETREKLQMIRVKFLRLAHRLGQTPHNVVVAQVLYRLGLAEQLRGRNGGRVGAFSFDRASAMAEQLEAAGQEPLDFSCTIMVLGKTGVGKSATINSIFDEVKFNTSAFSMGTKKVQDVVGTVQGIKVRVIDTPGLLPSWSDQRSNEKILLSVKNFIKKTPPDIVLYLDRLDMQSRDFSDMPLLRTITEIFGPSIWFNAIVVLTHAASAPPEGPNGTASSYDMFVTQRSHVVQQAIRQAAGDMRLMNPVSLVENHSACRTNRAGQRVLPNGQVWKPHLLLLSFASKILAEANALLKLQDSPPGKPYIARSRAPPLPFLLSTLLQSRPQLKLPEEQFGDEDSLDDDLDEASESDDENEHDDLPPFKPLTKAQVEKLSKAHRNAYFDELEYREKLLMKKQLKEEKKRRKLMKKMAEAAKDLPSDYSENAEEEGGGAASVPVPMPDLALPASFDSDNPTHRYRYLDSSNQWLVRPVLETHGWDHDVGYEGLNVERLFVVKDRIPLSFTGQVTKDKKDANVQMEVAGSVKHGEGKATSLGFDMQTVGKDLAYTLRSETRFTNFRRNKATAGLSFTLLGDALSGGVKIEDKLVASKRFKVVISGGAMAGRNDIAYGGSLEAQLRDKDYPLGRFLSTLGLSVMDWHGDLAVGCNVQSQIPVGRHTNLVARANLNNRGAGQISIRLNSSEQLQIALVALIPLVKKLVGYPQQLQYGQY